MKVFKWRCCALFLAMFCVFCVTASAATTPVDMMWESGNTVARCQNELLPRDSNENGYLGHRILDSYISDGKSSAYWGGYGTWEFTTNYLLSGTQDVLWLCKSSSGTIMAWATGVYDVETNTFSGIKYGVLDSASYYVDWSDSQPTN